jgi:N-acetylmuramoyl-L-alanine amidase
MYRLVLDIKPSSRTAFLAAVKENKKFANSVTKPEKIITPQPKSGKKIIVIDAGHGGIDPGNLGVIGVPEKTIALKIARVLRDVLSKNFNYEVLLTRDRDIFIPLRGRVDFARNRSADLFISIHADSFRQSKVRGATIYTLSEKSSDREAERLALKENRSDAIAGINLETESDVVTSILIDLAQRETMNLSADLANIIVSELKGNIVLRTNSHRFAGLMVLKAADVPSILLETGYLTNRQDANNLNSPKWQKTFAQEVKKGVDKFFTSLEE